MSERDTLYVYSDEGVSARSYRMAVRMLEAYKSPHFKIKKIKADDIVHGAWQESAHALLIPGGRDVPYHDKLQGLGTQNIRKFVEDGGVYIGICAGAYFACKNFEFARDSDLEIVAERELQFFPGLAVGPLFNTTFCYHSEKGAYPAKIMREDTLSIFSAYYNGGCLFSDVERYPHIKVVARYAELEEKPAAIIQISYGKGTVLLSGVHIEYDIELLQSVQGMVSLDLFSMLSLAENDRRLFVQQNVCGLI